MRVVHCSTYERSGGAARAARRLHLGLRASGVDSRMLVLHRETTEETTVDVQPEPRAAATWSAIERRWIHRNRTVISNTWFSTGRPGCDVRDHPWIRQADVVHLHWVPGLLASRNIAQLLDAGVPIVWTLHDEWALSGGCHFTAGCDQWRSRCGACPQLRVDPHRIVEAVFDDKCNDLQRGKLLVAAPSRWLAERASVSPSLGGRSCVRIEHGLDLTTWTSSGREDRRREWNLGADDVLILFTAGDVTERRKGFHILLAALESLEPVVGPVRLHVAVLGVFPAEALEAARHRLRMPLITCGSADNDIATAGTFAAADLFVIPSLEDNLPNTIVEALACGTPVIGSTAGGIPEALERQSFEACASVGDAKELERLVRSFLSARDRHDVLRVEARSIAERHYALDRHVRAYIDLYHEAQTARRTLQP